MTCHLHAARGISPISIVQKGACTIPWTLLPLPGIVAKKSEEKAARQCKEEREGNKGYEWKEKKKSLY